VEIARADGSTAASSPTPPAAESPKPEPDRRPEPSKPIEVKPAPAEPARPAAAPAAGDMVNPAKGTTYLQVMAVGRTDAELMVNLLRKKGFSAVIAAGPSDVVFRVLVGPLADSAAISQTRADLQAAGFKGPIVKRY
jgi:cell division septation protein DedD